MGIGNKKGENKMKKRINNKLDKNMALVDFGGKLLDVYDKESNSYILTKIYKEWVVKEHLDITIDEVIYNDMLANGVVEPHDTAIKYVRMLLDDEEIFDWASDEILEELYKYSDDFKERVEEELVKSFKE